MDTVPKPSAAIDTQQKKPIWVYYAALAFVVLFWGLSSVVYSWFYRYYSAAVLSSIMTFFSAIFFLLLGRKKLKFLNRKYLKIALPICLLNALANVLQRIGLQYTTPANYAFFEHLSCVVVPVMMFVFVRKKITLLHAAAGICCLTGCFILCGVGIGSGAALLGIGDALCIIAGVLIGVCVAAIGAYIRDLDTVLFMVLYMISYFLVSFLMTISLHHIRIDGIPMEQAVFAANLPLLLLVILLGLVDIAVCWLLRTEAIRHTDPVTVATVSPFSAVITGIVSVLAGIDRFSFRLVFGGGLIMIAVVLPEIINGRKLRQQQVLKTD